MNYWAEICVPGVLPTGAIISRNKKYRMNNDFLNFNMKRIFIKNISTLFSQASECHAMKHCIKKVWENPTEKLPADNDSVCEVCLDMVKQARDQLLSNETQVKFTTDMQILN